MDDDASALEHAIADLGALLVQMDKFRARHGHAAAALRAACLAIGDRARRAHRHGVLAPALATELGADAAAARQALQAWLDAERAGPLYRTAVAAHRRGDWATLAATLPRVFDGAAVVPAPATLHHPVAWQRRGRPRPATEVADDLARLRRDGLAGDGDPLTPGMEPELPAVAFQRLPVDGDPLCLVVGGAALPPCLIALAQTDDLLLPARTLIVPFAALLAPAGADAELNGWVLDPDRYRAELSVALAACGVPVVGT